MHKITIYLGDIFKLNWDDANGDDKKHMITLLNNAGLCAYDISQGIELTSICDQYTFARDSITQTVAINYIPIVLDTHSTMKIMYRSFIVNLIQCMMGTVEGQNICKTYLAEKHWDLMFDIYHGASYSKIATRQDYEQQFDRIMKHILLQN